MKLSTLKGGTSLAYVEVPPEEGAPEGTLPEKVGIKWRPGEVTLGLMDDLKALAADPVSADVEAIRAFLLPILAWWDLEDEEGENLPVSGETIKTVPLSFLSLCLNAIQEDLRPNPQRDETSDGTSPPEEPQVESLTGTQSSESPTDSDAPPGN